MNEKPIIRIGYLTSQDPLNRKSWSGIHYFLSKELEERYGNIIFLGPVKINSWIKELLLKINKFHLLFYGRKFNRQHNNVLSIYYSRQFRAKIKNEKIDVIIAPAASTEIAYLKTKIPIIYISDTSYGQIKNYYDSYSNFSDLSNKIADKIEQRAITKAFAIVYSSNWAAEYVKNNYKIGQREIQIIHFGANIDIAPSPTKNKKKLNEVLKLLFLGKQWDRKGGPLVLETTRMLHSKGFKVHLTICGCNPTINTNEDYITVYPFLNKNKKQEYENFLEIMNESHLLFLPTKADCTPIVFCEAAAFGLPVLSRDTGGVSSIIHNGINGILLSEEAGAQDYFNTLLKLIEKPNRLLEMSDNARKLYENKFNWNIWGNEMESIILDAFKNK